MSDPSWVELIFFAALEKETAAERADYLEQACGGDDALRRQVERLLEAYPEAKDFLAEPAIDRQDLDAHGAAEDLGVGRVESLRGDGAGPFLESDAWATIEAAWAETQREAAGRAPDPPAVTEYPAGDATSEGAPAPIAGSHLGGFVPGQIIAGRYTLLEVLGEGGMGTVYRAEQVRPVKRQVALELIKTGMDSRAVLARFDAERQALAMMDYPNIARVYDGGATEANQPFFVMELVSGLPITDYCDQHRLPVRARLELFVAVCQAVQHAHQKGIIHRDLKPGNILVTELDGRPTPKVIDFGVAKAIEINLTDQSFADTGAIVGTPTYMSPEQADPSSMDLDTRTDIYALGVILYELLAGSPPIDAKQFQRGAILEMLRMVREVDPPRLSTKVSTADALPSIAAGRGTSPEHLKRSLRGDIDWIVMKALEKDRTRRYETANGFAADILRHLAHEPVLAAPPSQAYRVRKFIRKHKVGVIAAGLVLLTLLAGIAGTTWGLIEARMRAEGERRATQKALAATLAEKKAKETAEVAEEAGRRLLYTTDMRLAPFLWRDDRTTAEHLRELLAKHIPDRTAASTQDATAATARPDLRGFEWYYYQHLPEQSATVFSGHAATVVAGAFTTSGRLVTLDQTAQVRRWDVSFDVEDEASRRDLRGGSGPWRGALSPDGRLAALNEGKTVRVFDTSTGQETLQIDSTNDHTVWLIFSRDSDKLVLAGRSIRWLSASSGQVIASVDARFAGYSTGTSLALSGDGLTLAVAGHKETSRSSFGGRFFSIFRLNPTVRAVIPVVKNVLLKAPLRACALGPDGRRMAVGLGTDGILYVFDTATGRPTARHDSAHAAPISAIAFSGDGTTLATADRDGTIKIWSDAEKLTSNSAARLTLKGHRESITMVGFSSDGKRLASTSADKTARVWDLEKAGAAVRPVEQSSRSLDVKFSPDGLLIAAAEGSAVRLWDAATGRLVQELSAGDSSSLQSVAFSPTDHRLLAVGHGGTIGVSHVALWDIDAGTELARLAGATDLPGYVVDEHAGPVGALAFSPDGKYLVAGFGARPHTGSANSPSPVKVWEVATRRLIHRLDGHTGFCVSLGFSRDGTLLASASRDGTAILWSTETWKPVQTLANPDRHSEKSHAQAGRMFLAAAAFSPDSRTLAMASESGNLHLWNVASGKVLATLKGHSNEAKTVVFSPDGRTLVSASSDQTVRLWNVQTRRELMQLDPGSVALGPVWSLAFSPDSKQLLAGGDRAAFWSAAPVVWDEPGRAAETLRLLLHSNADFQNRIRLLSENLRLHEALEKLDANDPRVQAALAATQANWRASRHHWPEAALAFDRLAAVDPIEPEAWLRTPGLLRVATALFHQDRPADAAMLLQGGAARRSQDGLPAISRGKTNARVDEATGALLFPLLAAVEKRLAEDPQSAGLLELRAALNRQETDFAREVADYTAAIKIRTEETGEAPSAPLQRLYRRRGDAYVGLRQWQQALDDYAHIVTGTTKEEELLANQAMAEASLFLERESAATWTILAPLEMKAEGRATLTRLEDNSIVVRGPNPAQDRYTVTFCDLPGAIHGLRLEVLTDRSLPHNGPGRYTAHGGFDLTTIKAQLDAPSVVGGARGLKLASAFADFSQSDCRVDGAIDSYDSTGWAVFPETGKPHFAVFELAEPVTETAGKVLRVTFEFKSRHVEHGLGRFRLSVAGVRTTLDREQQRFAALEFTDPWHKLAAVYRLKGEQPAIDQLLNRYPRLAGPIGDLFNRDVDEDRKRAVEIYSRGITAETTDVGLLAKRARAHEGLKQWDAAAVDWSRAAAGSDKGAGWLAEFARRLVAGGQRPLAAGPHRDAQTLYEQALAADPGNDRLAGELAELILDRQESEDAPSWTVLRFTERKSDRGATLTLQDDDSILASGINASGDIYTLTTVADLDRIAAVRLEALPDPSLPNAGPGRHPTGNFQLSAVRLYQSASDGSGKRVPVPVQSAWASFDYRASDAGIVGTVDERLKKVWHVWGRFGQANHAVFDLKEPVTAGPGRPIIVTLQHRVFNPGVNLGRFRLSVIGDPAALVRHQKRVAAAKHTNPWHKLAAAYHAIGRQAPEKLQSRLDAHSVSPTSETREPLARGNPPVKRDTPQEASVPSQVETVKLRPVASGASARIGGNRPKRLHLAANKPEGLAKAPELAAPLYGVLALGPQEAPTRMIVALDEPEGKPSRLHIDANANGDLTDDPAPVWTPKPRKNQDGREWTEFAGNASIPLALGGASIPARFCFYRFDKNDPTRPDYKDDLFYYADYGFEGEITLGDTRYNALLVDHHAAGDFRGTSRAAVSAMLMIDLNGNGKRDAQGELWDVDRPFTIKGTRYQVTGLTVSSGELQIKNLDTVVAEVPPPPDLSPGQQAIRFTARTTDDQEVSFPSSYAGKLVLLDFWATGCGPCIAELPHLTKAYEMFHDEGFEVLGISLDQPDSGEKVASFLREKHMLWRQVYDGKSWKAEVAALYAVDSIPRAYLVDGDTGEILATGAPLRGQQLSETIAAALRKKGLLKSDTP